MAAWTHIFFCDCSFFFYAITCYDVFINAPEGCHVVLITLIACKDMAHEWVAMVHVYQQCGQGPVLARYTEKSCPRSYGPC